MCILICFINAWPLSTHTMSAQQCEGLSPNVHILRAAASSQWSWWSSRWQSNDSEFEQKRFAIVFCNCVQKTTSNFPSSPSHSICHGSEEEKVEKTKIHHCPFYEVCCSRFKLNPLEIKRRKKKSDRLWCNCTKKIAQGPHLVQRLNKAWPFRKSTVQKLTNVWVISSLANNNIHILPSLSLRLQ